MTKVCITDIRLKKDLFIDICQKIYWHNCLYKTRSKFFYQLKNKSRWSSIKWFAFNYKNTIINFWINYYYLVFFISLRIRYVNNLKNIRANDMLIKSTIITNCCRENQSCNNCKNNYLLLFLWILEENFFLSVLPTVRNSSKTNKYVS